MGLWLQCPGCQTKNPLALRVCPVCGRSLDNLPPELRVYVIGPAEAPAPAPVPETVASAPEAAAAEPPAASAEAPPPEAPKAVKKPKKTRKKKG
jgi:hypothetical protein